MESKQRLAASLSCFLSLFFFLHWLYFSARPQLLSPGDIRFVRQSSELDASYLRQRTWFLFCFHFPLAVLWLLSFPFSSHPFYTSVLISTSKPLMPFNLWPISSLILAQTISPPLSLSLWLVLCLSLLTLLTVALQFHTCTSGLLNSMVFSETVSVMTVHLTRHYISCFFFFLPHTGLALWRWSSTPHPDCWWLAKSGEDQVPRWTRMLHCRALCGRIGPVSKAFRNTGKGIYLSVRAYTKGFL